MKNNRIAIRGGNSIESTIALAPAVAALRARFPDAAVTFVGEESLREAASLIPGLDDFAADFNTVGAASAFCIEGPIGQESTDWRAYQDGPAGAVEGNPYHRVDLLRKVVGADLTDVNFELLPPECDTRALPESLVSGNEGLRVALSVGSLEDAELEAILQGISTLGFPREVYLVGTIKDRKKSSQITSHRDGQLAIHDLCGHLSLSQTAYVLRHADVSISGPGAPALISSGYGTFTICVDSNPKRGPLDYPYGHGHLVIQSVASQDLAASLAPVVQGILAYAVSANSGNVPTLDQWQAFADSQIDTLLGKIRLLATQRIELVLGGESRLTELHLRPLIFLGFEASDVMETFYRLLWEHSLNARTLTSEALDILHQDCIPTITSLLSPLEKLFELSRFGQNYSLLVKSALATGNIELAQVESAKVQEVEELIFRLGESFPALSPLCRFHSQCQNFIPELDPVSLAEEMSDIFADLQSRVLVVLDLAKTLFHTTFEKETASLAGSSSPEMEG